MKVFLGVTEVAGFYRGLKSGFEELGLPCTLVDLGAHRFRYGGGDAGPLVRAIRRLDLSGPWYRRSLANCLRVPLFVEMAMTHDLFIFGFATSLLPGNRDLPILHRLGKKVIFQFHGSDSRPTYLDGAVMSAGHSLSIPACIERTRRQKRGLERIDQWADVVVDLPTQGHFHTRPFVQWLRVGLPVRPSRLPPTIDEPDGGTIRVLHSPSDPAAKGSDEIRAAVRRLRAKGIELELVEITGRPNSEVLSALESSHFVVDQLFADYAMPGFATEAAWFGRPAVVGGYSTEAWKSWLPESETPPTMFCRPDQVESAIERLATDRGFRRELGARAHAFVTSHWHPKAIAARYLDLVKSPIPPEWLCDPVRIRYWQGVAHSEARARNLLREYVKAGGKDSLFLDDKPELQRLLLDIAAG